MLYKWLTYRWESGEETLVRVVDAQSKLRFVVINTATFPQVNLT